MSLQCNKWVGTASAALVLTRTYHTMFIITHTPSLPPQDPNRRSQLWRMTSSRQLVHISSSSSSSSSSEREMVLGVAGRLPPPGQFTPLLVERRRESREDRQTWRFTAVRGSCVLVCVCGCGCVGVGVFVCLCPGWEVAIGYGETPLCPEPNTTPVTQRRCSTPFHVHLCTYSTYSNSHTLMYVVYVRYHTHTVPCVQRLHTSLWRT